MTLRLKAGRADTASVVACVLVWAVLWFQLFELKQVRRGRISEMADKFPEVCVLCVCVCVCVCVSCLALCAGEGKRSGQR